MQKIFIEFKFVVNEKEYRISCEPNSPFADCKEAAFLFLKHLGALEDAQRVQSQEAPSQDEVKQDQQVES